MIAFRDFKPEKSGLFTREGKTAANFAAALTDANAWIDAEGVSVLNVETVETPLATYDSKFIRVWFHGDPARHAPTPED